MTLLLDERLGAQRPRHLHLPPGKATSSGPEVVELAESAGLILDDWQAFVLEEALAERADGQWAAFEACLICPRQNGKGSVLEALELAALFLFGTRLIVHSAHEFKTAREHFLRMQTLVKASDELFEQVDYIHTGAGTESIALKNGARLNFLARSKGSGRGFSGDLVVLDEAMFLPEQAIGAMLPALSARPNPQVWYTGSAPHSDSHVLHGVRNRGLAENPDDALFFAEWGNDPDVEWDDPEALAAANPGLGIRISLEHCFKELNAMRELGDEYPRERLGVPSIEDTSSGIFPPGTWAACLDEHSAAQGKVTVALDVSPGMTFASFAVAGKRADGLIHGELIKRHPGTEWVIDQAKDYAAKYGPIHLDPKGPVGGLVQQLREANIPVTEIAETDLPRACAGLQERVLTGTFRHIGQPPLDNAVAAAAIRTVTDSWRWSRTGSKVDISPLVALTVAAGAEFSGPSEYWSASDL